ncbi:hypothetical protein COUCH_31485 [Couchioplanes caeruleus]|uniref:hypothetical protein n=1 Tax=Couchioplanes caeruleus TaxID=56438 RepID=UPI0020BD7511|nr:hypothetical protein [Couchioplanes caeruleus]UQU63495.1 hypothetical protein COUCH_31485 [Couchioplanes caeruleus]
MISPTVPLISVAAADTAPTLPAIISVVADCSSTAAAIVRCPSSMCVITPVMPSMAVAVREVMSWIAVGGRGGRGGPVGGGERHHRRRRVTVRDDIRPHLRVAGGQRGRCPLGGGVEVADQRPGVLVHLIHAEGGPLLRGRRVHRGHHVGTQPVVHHVGVPLVTHAVADPGHVRGGRRLVRRTSRRRGAHQCHGRHRDTRHDHQSGGDAHPGPAVRFGLHVNRTGPRRVPLRVDRMTGDGFSA